MLSFVARVGYRVLLAVSVICFPMNNLTRFRIHFDRPLSVIDNDPPSYQSTVAIGEQTSPSLPEAFGPSIAPCVERNLVVQECDIRLVERMFL